MIIFCAVIVAAIILLFIFMPRLGFGAGRGGAPGVRGPNISDTDVQVRFLKLIELINKGQDEELLKISDVAGTQELKKLFGSMTLGAGIGGKQHQDFNARCGQGNDVQKCYRFMLENKDFFVKGGSQVIPYTYRASFEFGGIAAITLTFPASDKGKIKDLKVQRIEVAVPREGNDAGFAALMARVGHS